MLAGTLTLADNQISGDKEGGTIAIYNFPEEQWTVITYLPMTLMLILIVVLLMVLYGAVAAAAGTFTTVTGTLQTAAQPNVVIK